MNEKQRIVRGQVNFDVRWLSLNQSPLLTMPLAAKRATWTNFVAKSRSTLSVFCNNFSNTATSRFDARQVWTWVVKRATSLFNSFFSNAAKQAARSGLHCIIYLNCRITFSCYEEILVSFPMYSRTQRGACKSDWVEAWRPGCWS